MDRSTVFVRNLVFDITDDELVTRFEEVGPVRRGFVVKRGGTSRGFGFVQFALEEDAQQCVQDLNGIEFRGRPLKVALAGKKGTKFEDEPAAAASAPTATASQPPQAPGVAVDHSHPQTRLPSQPPSQPQPLPAGRAKVEAQQGSAGRSVLVWRVQTPAAQRLLVKRASTWGTVQAALMKQPNPACNMGEHVCRLVIASVEQAKMVVWKLNGHKLAGAQLCARREAAMATSKKALSTCRLIIRNLPFTAAEGDLLKEFGEFGPVHEVHVPRKEGGKQSRGFGFVQFLFRADASAAMLARNGKPCLGRTVAVDWALEKDKWQQMVQEMGDDAAEDATALRPPVADATASVVPDALRESEQEAEEEEQEGNDNVQGAVESEDYDDDEGADEESDAGEDYADMDAAEDAEAHVDSAAPPAHKFADADAGTTLFVRNVSIDNTESDLLGVFKRFGRVAYVKLVRDSGSAAPHKGTAFVQFCTLEAAEAALQAASLSMDSALKPMLKVGNTKHISAVAAQADVGGITLAGRRLILSRAVSKDEAKRRKDKAAAKVTDRRHLYLAREGNIGESSAAAHSMPSSDLGKRMKAQAEKRQKLTNPLFFVSPTRLSVRNLGKHVSDADLKLLFRTAAAEGVAEGLVRPDEGDLALQPAKPNPPVRVQHAKIVREVDRAAKAVAKDAAQNSTMRAAAAAASVAVSKGFGFVEFADHVHALAALRVINNNPSYTQFAVGGASNTRKPMGVQPRLIVEFAVENHAMLQRHERKLQARRAAQAQRGQQPASAAPDAAAARPAPGVRTRSGSAASTKSDSVDAGSVPNAAVSRKEIRAMLPSKRRKLRKQLRAERGEDAVPLDTPPQPVPMSAPAPATASVTKRTASAAPLRHAPKRERAALPPAAAPSPPAERRRRPKRSREQEEEAHLDRLLDKHKKRRTKASGL